MLPHAIWFGLYSIAAFAVAIVNWFATLIRGRSPERIHNWLVRYVRYTVFVYAYFNLLANPYPPFHGTAGSYPIDLEVDGPETQRRLITAFRPILAIPAWILNYVFGQVLQIVALIGWFVAIAIGPDAEGAAGPRVLLPSLPGADDRRTWCDLTDRYPSFSA